jgi:hypothetical protein
MNQLLSGLGASPHLAPSGCDPLAPAADLLGREPKALRLLCCTVDCIVQLVDLSTGKAHAQPKHSTSWKQPTFFQHLI